MHMVDPNRRELFILSTVTFDLLQVHKKSYKVKGTDRFSALPSAESRPLPWRPTRPARLVFSLHTQGGRPHAGPDQLAPQPAAARPALASELKLLLLRSQIVFLICKMLRL